MPTKRSGDRWRLDYDRFTALYERYFEHCRFSVIRIPGHFPLKEQIALSQSEPLLRDLAP